MKKLTAVGLGVCAALAFSSCKSSESAYKKAYEKAKQQELAAQTTEPAGAAPVVVAPTTTTTTADTTPRVVETTTVANTAGVRQEKLEVVSGNNENLKDFSVVCGSFGVKANAESLKDYLSGQGYPSVVAAAETREGRMYRVIVASYATRDEAAGARDAFKAKYPNRADFQGSWLLYRLK
jgi:cell division protein FtsN